jgi:hypothetical protein
MTARLDAINLPVALGFHAPTARTAFRLSILGMSRRGADREQIRRAPIVHAGQMQSDSQSTQTRAREIPAFSAVFEFHRRRA